MRRNQWGFGALEIIMILVVVTVLGSVGWIFYPKKSNQPENNQNASNNNITTNNSQKNCNTKPVITLPVDISKVEAILYPGQIRGGNYKPHGGFRLNTPNNQVSVTLPLDAKLIDGSRYLEQGEVQYMFDFEADCKIHMRFDHLSKLSPELMAEADKLPQPKPDDSRTTNLNGTMFKLGTLLATEVGFKANHNVTFDFGMYDYNDKNKISSDSQWANDPQHQFENAQYGVCWFDYLSPYDKQKILSLPAGDQINGKTNDYCK